MSSKIKLVQGDNYPYIRLTMTDPLTKAPIDLSNSGVVVRVYFRAAETDLVLATLLCEKVDNGVNGVVRFNFPNGVLDVEPGLYEGEVEIDFDGLTQTVYQVLKFNIRPQFA